MIVVFTILMFGLFREAHGLVDDIVDEVHATTSTSDTGLSDACQEALDSGDMDDLRACAP